MSVTSFEEFRNQARRLRDSAGEKLGVNVGETERVASVIGGSTLAVIGLKERSITGAALALLGGALVFRGVTGHCPVYGSIGLSTAEEPGNEQAAVKYGRGVRVDKSVTIAKAPEELFAFWRNVENLPRFMSHLESVTRIDDKRSHWVAKAPAGQKVEWDAEIINEIQNELIGWKSLEGADVDHAGSVHFLREPDGAGTSVKVELRYDPPAGKAGVAVAKLFREDAATQIDEDLRRLKALLEAGEVAGIEDQPTGR